MSENFLENLNASPDVIFVFPNMLKLSLDNRMKFSSLNYSRGYSYCAPHLSKTNKNK